MGPLIPCEVLDLRARILRRPAQFIGRYFAYRELVGEVLRGKDSRMMVQAASFEGTTDVPVSQRLDETALRLRMTTELGADPGPLRVSKASIRRKCC